MNSDDLANCGASDCRIASKATGVQDQNHNIMLSTIAVGNDVRLRFRLKAGGSTTSLVASSGNFVNGQWIHVAGTYDGSNMRVYVDGVEVGSAAKTGVVGSNPAVPFWIGGNPDSPTSRPWDGKIDDVRLYDGALSPAEIQALAISSPNFVEKIYWADSGKLQRASLNGANVEDLVISGISPNGVAVAPLAGRLFWADEGGGCCVGSADLDGTNQAVVDPSGGRMIAVDEEDDWLFWVFGGMIMRSHLDGTMPSSIATVGTNLTGIALDSSANVVYWADHGGDVIGTMDYAGLGVTQIFGSTESANVYDLAFDPVTGMLFWADESTPGTIRRGFPDGTGFEEIVSNAGQPLGIAVDGLDGKVYWSDRVGFIKRANLDGSGIETVVSGLTDPRGVALGPSAPGGVPPVPSLTPRTGHTATLLQDGTVLIAGGIGTSGLPLVTAEIFDPATGAVTLVGSMAEARTNHSASMQSDGTVLIIGGTGLGGSPPLSSVELFNPATNTFQ